MQTRSSLRVLLTLAFLAAGCSSSPPAHQPGASDPELEALKERAKALAEKATQKSPPSDLAAEGERLAKDVRDWQNRTGGKGIYVAEGTKTAKAATGDGPDCPHCPPLDADLIGEGMICRLTSEGECENGERVCVYSDCVVFAEPERTTK